MKKLVTVGLLILTLAFLGVPPVIAGEAKADKEKQAKAEKERQETRKAAKDILARLC